MTKNPYLPRLAKITSIIDEAPQVKTFEIEMANREPFTFEPGQFIELTVFMYGEAPFSISSKVEPGSKFEITVKKVGVVTSALFNLKEGATVGVRGPFGRGWPLKEARGLNVLIVAGGIGLAPLRPVIWHIIERRRDYGDVVLLYGVRTPADLIYRREYPQWEKFIDVRLTVDKADEKWKGRVGVVTLLLDDVDLNPHETICFQCGPPIMLYYSTKKLLEMGFPEDHIVISLERLMKCGMGFCGHCTISGRYVCLEGPVFRYNEVKGCLERAI